MISLISSSSSPTGATRSTASTKTRLVVLGALAVPLHSSQERARADICPSSTSRSSRCRRRCAASSSKGAARSAQSAATRTATFRQRATPQPRPLPASGALSLSPFPAALPRLAHPRELTRCLFPRTQPRLDQVRPHRRATTMGLVVVRARQGRAQPPQGPGRQPRRAPRPVLRRAHPEQPDSLCASHFTTLSHGPRR